MTFGEAFMAFAHFRRYAIAIFAISTNWIALKLRNFSKSFVTFAFIGRDTVRVDALKVVRCERTNGLA